MIVILVVTRVWPRLIPIKKLVWREICVFLASRHKWASHWHKLQALRRSCNQLCSDEAYGPVGYSVIGQVEQADNNIYDTAN